MRFLRSKTYIGFLCGAMALALLAGCGKDDPVSKAAKKDVAAGVSAPGIAEVKAIAEEGFIYGLPIVMNYAVMYEFVIDRNSGQFKAPFNQISNEHRVFTYKDTADRHAEQRHAVFHGVAGPARRADGALGAGGGQEALLLGDAQRRQHLQLRLHRQPRHRQRRRATTWSPARDWKGETPPGIKKVFRSTTDFSLAIFRTQLFNAEGHART